jgi:hypothetical protein
MRCLASLLASATLLLAATAFGQGTSFTARLGRNPVGAGESFAFEVTLSGDSVRMEDYRPPDFRGLRVVAEQPSQSTQIQMGGGGSLMRQTYTWHYELVASQKGKLVIGPATVRVDGREMRTDKVNVTVVEAAAAPPPRPRPPRGFPGFPDPGSLFPGLEPEPETEPAPDPARPAGRRNFLRVVPNKTRAFVGEQLTLEWSLCLVERQNNFSPTKEPRTDGFWVEDLEVPQSQRGLSLSEQVIDGRVYLVAPIMRKAIFGLKPGKYTITPLEADIARVGFFGAPVSSEHLKADPVPIEVVPLPAGAPAEFDSAAVGRFSLEAEVDRDHVQVGDAVTLRVRLDGQGNLRKITLPALPRLPGWKIYEPKVSVQLNHGDDVGGSKTTEYLLLPERPGETDIPSLAFSYFDTQKTTYVTERTAPLHLVVTGQALAQGTTAPMAAPAAAGSENLLAIDVRPLRNRQALRRDLGSVLYRSPAFLGVVVAPPALLAALGLLGAARARFGEESEGKRRRKLRRSASRRLRTATTLLHEGRLAPSLGEIERVLREILAGKMGRAATGMSRDELRAALAGVGAQAPLIDGTVAALDACDRARFAPGSITAEEASNAIDRAGEIIEGFEKLVASRGGAS